MRLWDLRAQGPVADVAKHLGCSRRLADLRFRELMGTTRLDEVKRRLSASASPCATGAALRSREDDG